MAYTIIGQNNSVTTIDDGNGHVLHVPSRVALAIGTTFTITSVNNNMATLEDSNGIVYRDIPCVVNLVDAGGGGGSLDTSKVVNADTLPTASADNVGYVYLYTGETDANYTHGYVYQNTVTTTYTDSITFDPASISGTTVTATAGALAGLCAEYGSGDITDIIKGTLTYDQSGDLLVFVGLDDTDTQVCTFQLYTQDYIDAGFTFTGTLADGDVINFAGTITESSSYAWERIDVQPAPEALPDQTGHSGKFLTTDGTDASWSDKPLVNTGTGTNSLSILGNTYGNYSISIGKSAEAGLRSVSIGGKNNTANFSDSIAIGANAQAGANGAIQLGGSSTVSRNNRDADTFKVGNANGNFEIMSADGTIPTARLTNAINKYSSMPTAGADYLGQIAQFTGTTDANYTHGYIYECVSDGGNPATYSWTAISVQAGGGGSLPSQTGNSGKFLTTDGTDASWAAIVAQTSNDSNRYVIMGQPSQYTGGIGAIKIGYKGFGGSGTLGSYSISIGDGAFSTQSGAISLGESASAGQGGFAVGSNTSTGQYSIACGYYAKATANGCIMINLTGSTKTNSDANTVKIANANGDFEIMSADGTIPEARLADTTSAAQGQVLMLDSNLNAVWASGGGGGGIQNTATGTDALTILGTAATGGYATNTGVLSEAGTNATAYGYHAIASGTSSCAVGQYSEASGARSLAIGDSTYATAADAIQLGASGGSNSDANTFKVYNGNGNFEMMDANGNLPADRLASTTGLADGNYKLRLTMSNGTPTLTWVAE